MKKLFMAVLVAVMGFVGVGCASSSGVCRLSLTNDAAVKYDSNVKVVNGLWAQMKDQLTAQISDGAGGAPVSIVDGGLAFTSDMYFAFLMVEVFINSKDAGTAYIVFRNDKSGWVLAAVEVKAPIEMNAPKK